MMCTYVYQRSTARGEGRPMGMLDLEREGSAARRIGRSAEICRGSKSCPACEVAPEPAGREAAGQGGHGDGPEEGAPGPRGGGPGPPAARLHPGCERSSAYYYWVHDYSSVTVLLHYL